MAHVTLSVTLRHSVCKVCGHTGVKLLKLAKTGNLLLGKQIKPANFSNVKNIAFVVLRSVVRSRAFVMAPQKHLIR